MLRKNGVITNIKHQLQYRLQSFGPEHHLSTLEPPPFMGDLPPKNRTR